jgi:hypothetical protein
MSCVEKILKTEDRFNLFKLEPIQQALAHHLLLLLKRASKFTKMKETDSKSMPFPIGQESVIRRHMR